MEKLNAEHMHTKTQDYSMNFIVVQYDLKMQILSVQFDEMSQIKHIYITHI